MTNEATCFLLLYVKSFLVAAVHHFKEDIILRPQKRLHGRHGHGPVDFALESHHTDATIGVTGIKRDDLKKGIAQNMVQLKACLVCVMNVWEFLGHANLLGIDWLQAQVE